ncbi:hypothetical protein [Novosphingobium sp.]|uniref:hypothetical protein n=1 Tax=Novosphingobium sp. TaxID=1874826 RepID=UPI002C66CE11|nr:hypothetical protein [Novosphingobium sp.]HQV04480.1 hypothetical protein [Novosphingobium sp.]
MNLDEDFGFRLDRHVLTKMQRIGNGYDPVKLLDKMLDIVLGSELRIDVFEIKIATLYRLNRFDDAFAAVKILISELPFRAESWIHLVKYFRDVELDCYKSFIASDISIAIAKLDGNFVIQCLSERVRTAIIMKDSDKAINSLKEMIEYNPRKGSIDEWFPMDFTKLPNSEIIPQTLLEEYIRKSQNH